MVTLTGMLLSESEEIGWLFDWLVGGLVSWFFGPLFSWLVGWLVSLLFS
jgi:hypothetical protein